MDWEILIHYKSVRIDILILKSRVQETLNLLICADSNKLEKLNKKINKN